MTTTVFLVPGFTSYHVDPGCNALDSARITVRGGAVRVMTAEEATANNRPACIVCAGDPNATEWTLTRANLGQLWELIEPSKPYVEFPAGSDKSVTTGLTIREHRGMPRQVARFGDRITHDPDGTYTVHPATQETDR